MIKSHLLVLGMKIFFVMNLHYAYSFNEKRLISLDENAYLWHRRLGHAPLPLISKLAKNDIVKRIAKVAF